MQHHKQSHFTQETAGKKRRQTKFTIEIETRMSKPQNPHNVKAMGR